MAIAPIAAKLDELYAETPRDEVAFYETLTRLATGLCLAITGHTDEDAIQEMVINVWQKSSSYASKSRYSTWAANVMRNSLRGNYRRRGLDTVELDAALNEMDDGTAMEASIQLKELTSRLSDEDRELVRLHLEGYTLEEIAVHKDLGTRQAAHKKWQSVMERLQEAAKDDE